ncbi:hypothetical protein GIB67_011681 [Kingdonia uniflora]|uniref:Uncharacterized protein n=1 Tax=Kingdonia uniflora TaxID=39325 RepID=A0A7J7LUF2_9MAGN|nr:hypothetical protein GIB67_011681 [Kingdonia uniflora]
MAATAKNDKVVLMICMAYTSTDEIVHAVQKSYSEKKGDIRHHEIDKELPIKLVDLEKHIYMVVAPDPDILVRTFGETRLSNFLFWQTRFCLCQLYSPNALWLDISLRHLEIKAIDCMVWAGLEYGYFQLYNYGCALVKSVLQTLPSYLIQFTINDCVAVRCCLGVGTKVLRDRFESNELVKNERFYLSHFVFMDFLVVSVEDTDHWTEGSDHFDVFALETDGDDHKDYESINCEELSLEELYSQLVSQLKKLNNQKQSFSGQLKTCEQNRLIAVENVKLGEIEIEKLQLELTSSQQKLEVFYHGAINIDKILSMSKNGSEKRGLGFEE